jgi:hypothetical protein
MNASLHVVAVYCEQRDWPYQVVSEHALMFRMDLPATELVCTADATTQQFTFQTFYPITVPALKRRLMEDFVVRANEQAEIGNLTLDPDGGVIGFRSSAAIDVSVFGADLVSSVIERHLEAAPLWLPGIAGVCFLGMSSQAALAHCGGLWPVEEVMRQASERLSADQ